MTSSARAVKIRETELGIAKNRNGATGWIPLDFDPPSMRFEEVRA